MRSRRYGRIRAMRTEEPQQAILARATALRPFLGSSPDEKLVRLRSMLRAERRAAHCGMGYSALRHAALHKLMTEMDHRAHS